MALLSESPTKLRTTPWSLDNKRIMALKSRQALILSLAAVASSHLPSSPRITVLAFTAAPLTCPSSHSSIISRADVGLISLDGSVSSHNKISSRLFDQSSEDHDKISNAEHIDDFTHDSILHNPLGYPVLVDCYTDKCGPCKLLERSLQAVLPKYSETLLFCKWNADDKENSQAFMNLIREHNRTFRKLPTLMLFVDGVPIAKRSGMATEGQLTSFLEENLPKSLPSLFVPTLRRRNAGGT